MELRDAGEDKAAWRKRLAAVRDGLSQADREASSEKICALLEDALLKPLRLRLGRPLRLCAYAPYRSEASPMALVEKCWALGDRVFATRMRPDGDGGGLELREVRKATDWRAGRWGVPEPDPRETELMDESLELDAIVVPGMGFDRSGGRLGYGGGYYDRLYAERRADGNALWIGFAYAAQLVPEGLLPIEEHDLRLDGLATDEEFRRFRQG